LAPFFLPGTGLCVGTEAGSPKGMNRAMADQVMKTCRTVAAIVSVYPAFEVRRSEEPAPALHAGAWHPGCRVVASGPTVAIVAEIDPAEAVRGQFRIDGWKEDIRQTADGPGTASFAFRKHGILCRVSGGAHSWIEGGKTVTSGTYNLVAGCVSGPEGATPGR